MYPETGARGSVDRRFELKALYRLDGLPELAARAVPYEAPRAVTTVVAAVASVGQRELTETVSNPIQRGTLVLGRSDVQLGDVDEIREHFVLRHEFLDAARESRRCAEPCGGEVSDVF